MKHEPVLYEEISFQIVTMENPYQCLLEHIVLQEQAGGNKIAIQLAVYLEKQHLKSDVFQLWPERQYLEPSQQATRKSLNYLHYFVSVMLKGHNERPPPQQKLKIRIKLHNLTIFNNWRPNFTKVQASEYCLSFLKRSVFIYQKYKNTQNGHMSTDIL